ncbi:MAG: NF038104 family lipoprotein [Pseudohongiella sp.]|uniref:NF038104 family lipoprotein n=1 Tax=Pseudohongiella sp. TaxID=1979412 RepID=UPI00349FE22B
MSDQILPKTVFPRIFRALVCGVFLLLTGCLGTVVGSAVDVTLEVAKVPFKVAGAAVDVVTDDDDDKDEDKN